MWMEIQEELNKNKQETMWDNLQNWYWPSNWQWVEQPQVPQWTSNYNNNPNKQQVWEPPLPSRWGVDIAWMLKNANE